MSAEIAPNSAPLGMIAGGGMLPLRVVESCKRAGRPVAVICLKGQEIQGNIRAVLSEADIPSIDLSLGEAAAMLDWLHQHGVQELVMVGKVRRPALHQIKADWRAAKLLARIGLKALGDDGLLRAVASELEAEGFKVVGVDSIVQDLPAKPGTLGAVQVPEDAWPDIQFGLDLAHKIGAADVGQSVIVQAGLVLAVEAIEGTDALIRRSTALHREGARGILVKARKPQQDDRLDLPVIGPDTVTEAASAGLRGIAVEADGVLLLEKSETIARADAAGLFLVGVSRS